jgi:hypothetical protein
MAEQMKSWSGLRLNIEAWWAPKKGDFIKGVLLQRNKNPGGKINQPFYVIQLTAPCEQLQMKKAPIKGEKGMQVGVAENMGLVGLDELLGFEVKIKLVEVREFTNDDLDGEIREVKEYDVQHSEKVVNERAASRYHAPA